MIKKMDIMERLSELGPVISEIDDPKSKGVIDALMVLVESGYSLAMALTEKAQELQDEINNLKGELGKARVKPNAQKSFSTEEERKAVDSKTPEVGFSLSKKKLTALRETRIPDEVLESLSAIQNRRFSSESDFMDAVADLLGKEQARSYRGLLLKYGCHKKRKRESKAAKIEVDRTEILAVDKSILPEDARPCGYEENIVQDIVIKRDNVRFRKEVYYSPALGKTFMADVPVGYEGGFGPNIKAEIVAMKYVNVMSEPKILAALRSYGVVVSPAYISVRLTSPGHMKPFIDEKNHLFNAALEFSSYQQIDDTVCRVNGSNQYVHILCNDLYSAFFTMPRKDRMTILDILRSFEPRRFLFNDDTFRFLETFSVSDKNIARIRQLAPADECGEDELEILLDELFPNSEKGRNIRTRITEAAAIAHYQQDHENNIVSILIADDAPQFKLLTAFLGLCWVHAGRHFKKLNPIVPKFQCELKKFQDEFWKYYGQLRKYQEAPDGADIEFLEKEFDRLFSTETGYPDLDERIEKTRKKKNELLLVLKHPEVPLHNNRSENGARTEKRRQDVSLHTKSEAGTKAKDAMMSNMETCGKLGVNQREFIKDRILGQYKIPRLGDLIKERLSS